MTSAATFDIHRNRRHTIDPMIYGHFLESAFFGNIEGGVFDEGSPPAYGGDGARNGRAATSRRRTTGRTAPRSTRRSLPSRSADRTGSPSDAVSDFPPHSITLLRFDLS